MKILVAHDGSAQSDALVSGLSRCGLPRAGEARVLCVADAWVAVEGGPEPAGSAAETLRESRERAEEVAASAAHAVSARLPGWRVQPETTVGSPSWEILRKSEEWAPDLLLLGATGTSAFERAAFGTTTLQVASHASCDVRIGRAQPPASGPVRLLIGFDGSAPALKVVEAVAAREWPAGSEARVVTAVDHHLVASLHAQGREGRSAVEAVPASAAEALVRAGLRASGVAIDGDPKSLLMDEAEDFGAESIFVGDRGRRGLKRLLLGSVALACASRAPCSVEIVRGG